MEKKIVINECGKDCPFFSRHQGINIIACNKKNIPIDSSDFDYNFPAFCPLENNLSKDYKEIEQELLIAELTQISDICINILKKLKPLKL